MIPPSRSLSSLPTHGAGDKRPAKSPTETPPGSKRARTEAAGTRIHVLPPELLRHIASFLVKPIDSRLDTATMRENLRQLTTLSVVQTNWKTSLSPSVEEACARYTHLYMQAWHTHPDACSQDSDEDDRPRVQMPLAFDGMAAEHIAFAVLQLLRSLFQADGSRFESAMVVRGLLKAAAELSRVKGVPADDQLGMERLPLTILALAFQRGLFADARRFHDLVVLLMGRCGQFSIAVQVQLKEDLESICAQDADQRQAIERSWTQATAPAAHEAARKRLARLHDLTHRSENNLRGQRLYALKEMESPRGHPSSPTRILTLAWIARHWDELPCMSDRAAACQTQLEDKVLALFQEFALDVDVVGRQSHARFLLEAFPASLRQRVFDRMTREHRKRLLRGIDVNALSPR